MLLKYSTILLTFVIFCSCRPQRNTSPVEFKVLPSSIIGGEYTEDHPTAVALLVNGIFQCSAFIIDSKTVMTAAHCLANFETIPISIPSSHIYKFPDTPSLLEVSIGSSNLRRSKGKRYAVKQYQINPEYFYTRLRALKTNGYYNRGHSLFSPQRCLTQHCVDFAYLTLEEEIKGIDFVPIIPTFEFEREIVQNSEVTVVGFGAPQLGLKHGIKIEINDVFTGIFTAGKHNYRDAQPGDSGGPVYYQNQEGIIKFVGITTGGIGFPYSDMFNIEDTGVWTRADLAFNWMKSEHLVQTITPDMDLSKQKNLLKQAISTYQYNLSAHYMLSELYIQENMIDQAFEQIRWILQEYNCEGIELCNQDLFPNEIWEPVFQHILSKQSNEETENLCHYLTESGDDPYLYNKFIEQITKQENLHEDFDSLIIPLLFCSNTHIRYWSALLNQVAKISNQELALKTFRMLFMYSSQVENWVDPVTQNSILHWIARNLEHDRELAIKVTKLAFAYIEDLGSVIHNKAHPLGNPESKKKKAYHIAKGRLSWLLFGQK